MKKIKYYFVGTLAILGLSSCGDSFLDKEVDLSKSAEQIFSKYDNTRGFLANIYTYLPDAFLGYTDGQYRGASRDCMTDNSLSYWNVHYYHSVFSDGYSAKDHPFSAYFWPLDFKGIRACNQFLTNARVDVIGNAVKSGDDNCLYDRYMAEAHVLRAILHFDLAGWFGAVPIIGDDENGAPIVLDPGDAGSLNRTRSSCADVLKWVADECDKVKDALPFRYANENENWGRINGAAAYALKSRALLYRASELNNPDNNIEYWKEAAQAAIDFINKNNEQSNPYKLYTTSTNDPNQNYYQCFVSTPHLNNEYILSRSEWSTREIELFLAPCGFSGNVNSTGRTNPTQNLVDSYEMANGLTIDDAASGYDEQNPYVNRDPRLEQTILHQGSIWGNAQEEEERQVDLSAPDGIDYQALHGGTTTGYYTKKFLNNMSFKVPTTYVHACPIFRYAEILLNAAEAINEAYGQADAYQYVNQVRARVGMPAYSGMTKDKLRERIRNERRIELCFEDHRFFDERRWKLFEGTSAAQEKSLPYYKQVYNIYSATATLNGTEVSYSYGQDATHPTRTFISPKNYRFPIPDDEVKKAPNLGQNAGWEL